MTGLFQWFRTYICHTRCRSYIVPRVIARVCSGPSLRASAASAAIQSPTLRQTEGGNTVFAPFPPFCAQLCRIAKSTKRLLVQMDPATALRSAQYDERDLVTVSVRTYLDNLNPIGFKLSSNLVIKVSMNEKLAQMRATRKRKVSDRRDRIGDVYGREVGAARKRRVSDQRDRIGNLIVSTLIGLRKTDQCVS
jgi:hypothetical protein